MQRKVSRKRNSRKYYLTLCCLFLALCAGVVLVLEKTKTTDLIKMPVSSEQKQAQEAAKTAAKNNEAQRRADEQRKQELLDSSVEKQNTPNSSEAPAVQSAPLISTMSARQEADTVVILTNLSPVASGSCILRITNGTKTHEQQARILYQPEFSSCAGFSVPKSSLSGGNWKITLEASGGDLSGVKTIEFEVK